MYFVLDSYVSLTFIALSLSPCSDYQLLIYSYEQPLQEVVSPPTGVPFPVPTLVPTQPPTARPTRTPSLVPTTRPTRTPSLVPTRVPTTEEPAAVEIASPIAVLPTRASPVAVLPTRASPVAVLPTRPRVRLPASKYRLLLYLTNLRLFNSQSQGRLPRCSFLVAIS
jgi:hypothetical protein